MTTPTRRRPLPPAAPQQRGRAKAGGPEAGDPQVRGARLRQRVRRASFACLALVPVCLVFWLLLASPLLSVQRVEVIGTVRLTTAQVLEAAAVAPGAPLARVDSPALRARVGALSTVARVRVVRAWPHTLRLQVTERTAVAAARQADGAWALVDVHGVRFAPSADQPPGLPALQVDPGQEPQAVQVVAQLPDALRGQVARVEVPSPSSVVLQLRDGRSIVWGAPGQAARKAAVVTALLTRPGGTIDVTSPDVAVVR